jgi:uncharacterized protein
MIDPPSPAEPSPPDPAPARYSRAPFPAYRYVPGRSPHPRSDPLGHAWGRPEPRPRSLEASAWADSDLWRAGVDLYNFAYWWEAHEAWEVLWRGRNEAAVTAALQGLIQIAASNLKRFMGAERAAQALGARGLARLGEAPSPFLGFDVRRFEIEARAYLGGERREPAWIVLDLPSEVCAP